MAFLDFTRSGRNVLACFVVIGFAALGGTARAVGPAAPRSQPPTYAALSSEPCIYVLSHGWHTGIILRREDILRTGAWPALPEFARTERFIEVGWGSEKFYMAPRITVPLALRTVLTATSSVMHVVGSSDPPAASSSRSEVVCLPGSPGGLRAICREIGGTFARDTRGRAIDLGRGLYGHSRFYRANGRYSLPSNCNAWTARVLRAGGYPVRGPSTLIAGRLMAQVRPLARVRVATPVKAGAPRARRTGLSPSGRGRPGPPRR